MRRVIIYHLVTLFARNLVHGTGDRETYPKGVWALQNVSLAVAYGIKQVSFCKFILLV